MSESEDFESLKVLELQNELKKRGLDTKGRKAELIERLRQAVNNGTAANNPTISDSAPSEDESNEALIKENTLSPSNDNTGDDEPEQMTIEPNPEMMENLHVEEPDTHEAATSRKRRLTDDDIEQVKENEESEDNSMENQNNKVEKDDETNSNDDVSKQKRKKKSRWGSEQDEESSEKQSTTKQTSDDDDDDDDDDNDDNTIENNSSSRQRERDHDRDHHRSSKQRDEDRHYSSRHSEKSTEREIPLPEEEIVQFNNDDVVLDFYTSDLNLAINADCLSASSKSNDALCFLWAGVRSTYGFKQGKICYEIRINEIINCPHMPDSEKEKFGIRVGWSNLTSGVHALQLGEFNDSFAYTSSGKKMSKNNDELIEETYGESFGQSDVVACYIDFGDNVEENFIRMSFTKNGQDFGQAFEFSKTNTNEFYPHILVKNIKFECNFGQLEQPWSEIKSDYTFAQQVPLEDRMRCSEPIVEKNTCQVILLSGLNGSGKTTWAKKYMEESSKKTFNLLNVEYVLSKMTVDGKLPTIKDRNDGTMLRVNIALQKLIEIAAQRRRNYIIDHVNTTRESQSKRQRLFTGYHKIGVAIIPDDEELKRRIEKLEKHENISIPSQWIKEAKVKFHLPQKGSSLEDVIYPELSYDDAKSLYDKVRRDYDQHRSSSRYDRHDDYHSSRNNNNNNNRNRYDDREHRSRDRDRDRDRYARSRSRDRDRDRRTSRDDSRFSSSSHRNDNYRGSGGGGGGGGGGYSRGGNGRYSDHRQDSRNNPRSGFHDGGGNNYRGRGGNFNNQSNDDRRGGYHQRNDFNSGGRGRGGFDNNRNQYNNRGSFHDNQRGGSGFRQDFNSQQRGRQFNDYDNNPQQQQGGGRGFMQNNNNNFNQQHERQGFGSRPPMQQQQQQLQQQQHSFHNPQQQQQQQQQRAQPLIQNIPSNQQQYTSHMGQQATNNPNLSLPTQTSLNVNQMSSAANVTQQSALDPWLALCAAALNTQPTAVAAPQQPQQDTNSLTQQWAQWLKTAQMAQTAQQTQPQLTVHQADSHHHQQQQQQQAQISDTSALYYQAYYAQLAAAQQQAAAAAAAAAGSTIGGVAPPSNNDK